MVKRLKECTVGERVLVDCSMVQGYKGVNEVLVRSMDAGEIVVETSDGSRVGMDGYEKVQTL
jgi:hypothetical protein|tara:strand:+ start:745 stop:930 length:186 start_codon:yes stop_codon:yes gene_type:complete